jgi:pyruvate/2-oxoglutarate dehydrogenase complex dihydrolipoamide dehydrogenase (E3) component
LTNETVFDCDRLPASLLVIDGGPVGTELGQPFGRLGSQVTIASAGEHILPREDEDVAGVLARRLRDEGVSVLDRARVIRAARSNGLKRVTVRMPEGERTIDVEEILVAVGRQPNIEDLGLHDVGVAVDDRVVRIDARCRTTVPSVWVVGDVAGRYQFTHWANYQARIVIRNALFPGSWACDFDTVPWTTFTEPEVARVGLSEADARQRGVPYDLFTASFEDNDRALCDGEFDGVVKVLTKREAAQFSARPSFTPMRESCWPSWSSPRNTSWVCRNCPRRSTSTPRSPRPTARSAMPIFSGDCAPG